MPCAAELKGLVLVVRHYNYVWEKVQSLVQLLFKFIFGKKSYVTTNSTAGFSTSAFVVHVARLG